MPIYEYACDDCGTKFEKLVRRSTEAQPVNCPACGRDHLTTQYSTFSARGASAKETACAPSGGCGADMCQGGMCGMNYN